MTQSSGRRSWLTALVLGLGVLAPSLAPPVEAQEAADPVACDRGWLDVTQREDLEPEGLAALGPDELWVAGGALLGGGRRAAGVLQRSGDTWTLEEPPPPSERDVGLMAIAASSPDEPIWAVGYARETDHVAAYATRRDGDGWGATETLRPDGFGATLTDVATAPEQGTWAAGFRQGRPGDQRPWLVRRQGDEWATIELPLAEGERATLSGIALSDDGGAWVVGTALADAEMRPYATRREGDTWVRHTFDGLSDAALADVVLEASDRGWAVGHQLVGATIEPLLLHWDGSGWATAEAPDLDAAPTLLTSVSAAAGVLSVGGATWDPERHRYAPFAARQAEGHGWVISLGRPGWGGGTVTDIVGDPGTTGWVVARADTGIIARVCEAPFQPVTTPVVAARTAGEAAETTPPEPPTPLTGQIEARDVAAEVGLPTESQSWSSTAADFDGDGDTDLFLGRHGARARLYRNDGGTFTELDQRFGGGDRHGCAAADVDDSGLPDLYCTFGAMRGTGTKQNQLWLDPGGDAPALEPYVGGASEPLGRGRGARFLDIDEDGDLDLFVGQEAKRMDGLPSTNRGFLRSAPATFEATPLPGIHTGLATEALDIADYDGDGRDDILLVYLDARALEPTAGIRLYRNEPGTAFTDVTEATGITTIGERDAALADLDGDGSPDLVQLAEDRVVISRWRDGRFEAATEVEVAGGVALASGDADGDGDLDLYIHQAKTSGGGRDLLLLNGGDGSSFDSLELPEARGSEDDVIALDYDGNGRMDFLALNGRNSDRGSVQLITLVSDG